MLGVWTRTALMPAVPDEFLYPLPAVRRESRKAVPIAKLARIHPFPGPRKPALLRYDARMRLPAALLPLRNATFRGLWLANVVAWLGTWLQNTGAGWLMTSLAPEPLIVAMVQAATIMPVFLLALPGGALADIVDRRVFLIGAQLWTILAAATLALLTITARR